MGLKLWIVLSLISTGALANDAVLDDISDQVRSQQVALGLSSRTGLGRGYRSRRPSWQPSKRRRRGRRRGVVSKGRARRTALIKKTFIEVWTAAGLHRNQQAALLTVAHKEGGFNLCARSADGLPDDKKGKSWGTFQFYRPTLRSWGLSPASMCPTDRSDAQIVRAARFQAQLAVRYLMYAGKRTQRKPWLVHTWRRHNGDASAIAREIFVIWSAGHGRRWSDITRRIARRPDEARKIGSLGYVHTQVARRMPVFYDYLKQLSSG